MKKTLQDQYLLIKEGKGHVGVFLTEAKRQFPNIVRNAATFDEAVSSLKSKNIISENVFSVMPEIMGRPKKESYETAFENFLAEARKKEEDEKVKAEEKKVSKPVEEDLSHNYDNSDDKNPDNMIFDQIMTGYYAEMKDPKNADKTMQELKDIVFKNLAKDPIYYTKDGQFGIKDLGYTTEAPGLGEPKEAKGKYKSSGYGDLNESQMYYTDEDEDETALDLKGELIQMGVSPILVDKIFEKFGIQGLKDRLKPKNVRDMSWTKGFTKEEQTLREVIREIIDGEIEEMRHLGSMFQSKLGDDKKDREDRDPSNKYLTFDKDFEKDQRQKGNLIVKANDRIFITKVLQANLGPKSGNSDLRTYLMDRTNREPAVLGGKEVWKIKGAKINSKGNISIFVPVEKLSLKEGVEKDLADINKEAEHEVLQAKLDKIDALIDHRRSKLTKLDEDEDMKALTDKKKVKELEKDIKKLEIARKKIDKMMSKFKGKKSSSKDVIDETENDGLDQQTVNDITTKYNEIYIKNGVVTDREIEGIADQYPFDQKTDIMDYLEGYSPSDEFDM